MRYIIITLILALAMLTANVIYYRQHNYGECPDGAEELKQYLIDTNGVFITNMKDMLNPENYIHFQIDDNNEIRDFVKHFDLINYPFSDEELKKLPSLEDTYMIEFKHCGILLARFAVYKPDFYILRVEKIDETSSQATFYIPTLECAQYLKKKLKEWNLDLE